MEGVGDVDLAPLTAATLALEGQEASAAAVTAREPLLRGKVRRLRHLDLLQPHSHPATYDLIAANYVLDSASAVPGGWRQVLARLASLVRPGGHLLLSALGDCGGFRLGGRLVPLAAVEKADLRRELARLGLASETQRVPVPEHAPDGYTALLFTTAQK